MHVARRARALIILLGLLALPATANAQEPDAQARARAHYETGSGFYKLGNYSEAVKQFAAGYQLAPRPAFLLNMAQCYRKLSDLEQSRQLFQRYLDLAPAGEPERAQIPALLAEIDRELAARHAASVVPPAPTATATAPAMVPLEATAPPAPVAPTGTSFAGRHWWVFPVAGAVVAGAATALYFGLRPAAGLDCARADYGCVDLRP